MLRLKGNIRVFCRVRPVTRDEMELELEVAMKDNDCKPFARQSVMP